VRLERRAGLMLHGTRLRSALSRVELIAVHGPWSRITEYRYLRPRARGKKPEPLWGGAAAVHGARFTPPLGFDSLYLAWDPITAMTEVQTLVLALGAVVLVKSAPLTLLTVDGIVCSVLDLTNPGILKALGTTGQEMTGLWFMAKNPPTQYLAEIAFGMGTITGIKYSSARHPGGINLVVFPDRLSRTDFLEVHDPYDDLQQRLP
jgi:RES domain-containing protein